MDNNLQTEKIKTNSIDDSVLKTLKAMNITIIVGWVLLIIIYGIFVLLAASIIIGGQLIRKQRIGYGLCIMFFGVFTLGIWPYIAAKTQIRSINNANLHDTKDYRDFQQETNFLTDEPIEVIESNKENSEINREMINSLERTKDWITTGWFLYILMVGAGFIAIASMVIGVHFMKRQRISYGVCLMIFGGITLGIWPYFAAKKEILLLENESIEEQKFYVEDLNTKIKILNFFNISKILSILGMASLVLFLVFFKFVSSAQPTTFAELKMLMSMTQLAALALVAGLVITFTACQFVAVQNFRRNEAKHGYWIHYIGWLTVGIWPLIYSWKKSNALNEEIIELRR